MAGVKGKSGRKPGCVNAPHPNSGRPPLTIEEKKVTIQAVITPKTCELLAREGQAAGLSLGQQAARILEMYAETITIA